MDKLISDLRICGMRAPLGLDRPPVIGFYAKEQCSADIYLKDEDGELIDMKTVWACGEYDLKLMTPLKPFTLYRVSVKAGKVRLKTEFSTGPLKPGDWFAPFIFDSEPHGRRTRRTLGDFTLGGPPDRVIMYACAFGDSCNALNVYINGINVIDDLCFPGNADSFTALEEGFDITDKVICGTNIVEAEMLRGFSLIFVIYKNGDKRFLATNEDWEFMAGTGISSVSSHDAAGRRLRAEEIHTEYKLSPKLTPCLKPNAAEKHAPLFILFSGPKVIEREVVEYQDIELNREDALLDFGRVIVGRPQIEGTGSDGAVLEMSIEKEAPPIIGDERDLPLLSIEPNVTLACPSFEVYKFRYVRIKAGHTGNIEAQALCPDILPRPGSDCQLDAPLLKQPCEELVPLYSYAEELMRQYDARLYLDLYVDRALMSMRSNGYCPMEFSFGREAGIAEGLLSLLTALKLLKRREVEAVSEAREYVLSFKTENGTFADFLTDKEKAQLYACEGLINELSKINELLK